MRYFVEIEGRTIEVDLDGDRVAVAGNPVAVDLRSVSGTRLSHMLLNGRSWPLIASPGGRSGIWAVQVAGRTWEVEVLDERSRAIREMTGAAPSKRGPRPVRAPMPGLVVRVEVEPGQSVRPGQGVVIVEAMKMENELKTDGGGIVSRILVSPGQVVEKGAVLIEFASAGA